MARSGGTVVSKCLGCMDGVVLLSEIHPNFCIPSLDVDAVEQAYKWFNLLTEQEVYRAGDRNPDNFHDVIGLINQRCIDQEKALVIRDWNHIDFTAVPYVPQPSFCLTTVDALKDFFTIIHTAIVRHPIDQWLSLIKIPNVKGLLSLDSFLHGYHQFAVHCAEIGFFKYEDFTKNPETQLRLLCNRLKLHFDPNFINRWGSYTKITGDIWGFGRGTNEIRPLPRRLLDATLLEDFKRNADYLSSLEILGYLHPEDEKIRGQIKEPHMEPSTMRSNINNRHTLCGTLELAKQLGFKPQTVIDVGAAAGTFELYETFPESNHILIEPLEEFRPNLEEITKQYNNIDYVIAAATDQTGSTTINVHPDLVGSSIYLEDEDSNVNGVPRIIKTNTLDEICRKRHLSGPYLIKIDVQGAELDVLSGASQILYDTGYIVLEVSLFEFFKGGPQIYDVIVFMKKRGFVLYDILDYQYRLLDGAMSQTDIVFVKESGEFRKHNFYASREQRDAQNKTFSQEKDISYAKDSRIDITCPHCSRNIYVSHKGNWVCPCCCHDFVC